MATRGQGVTVLWVNLSQEQQLTHTQHTKTGQTCHVHISCKRLSPQRALLHCCCASVYLSSRHTSPFFKPRVVLTPSRLTPCDRCIPPVWGAPVLFIKTHESIRSCRRGCGARAPETSQGGKRKAISEPSRVCLCEVRV